MSIWGNVVQLLLTLSPTTVALKVSQRPLRRSARAFSECSQGSDINVPRFLRAAKAYCDLVSRFGRFAVPSAGEISRCIVKVEQAAAQLAKNGTKGNSMKALLQAEVALGLHGPGGVLADPSAAMGLLWTRRGIAFWLDVFQQQIKKSASLKGQMASAYEHTRAPHKPGPPLAVVCSYRPLVCPAQSPNSTAGSHEEPSRSPAAPRRAGSKCATTPSWHPAQRRSATT